MDACSFFLKIKRTANVQIVHQFLVWFELIILVKNIRNKLKSIKLVLSTEDVKPSKQNDSIAASQAKQSENNPRKLYDRRQQSTTKFGLNGISSGEMKFEILTEPCVGYENFQTYKIIFLVKIKIWN